MRKLASIKQISEIYTIEGKDRIELAVIDGWQIIVKKDEFKVGDKCIFIEIDSVLPEKPEFEFLRSKKFRIKTMKMAGILSQGIVFPLSILPQNKNYILEEDVTNIIGIKKYESNQDNREPEELKDKFQNPIFKFLFRYSIFRKLFLSKKLYKGFPEFISKTDEPRIQNMPFILKNKDIRYMVREKLDGQSGTFFLKKIRNFFPWGKQQYDFGVCSRNLRLWKPDNSSYWFVAKKYNIKNILEELIGDHDFVAIQGECIAPNVQGNKYKVSEPDLYVFNLIYPNERVNCIKAEHVLATYNLKWCPTVFRYGMVLPDTINEILNLADGQSFINNNTLREGLVFRNYEKNISFKAVSPKWLIKYDE